jgi:hypothetical protein
MLKSSDLLGASLPSGVRILSCSDNLSTRKRKSIGSMPAVNAQTGMMPVRDTWRVGYAARTDPTFI